ncbi:gamma-tubulin complex component 5-like isoform X2 [Homarus americanus]|uniref:gamma-tubulin complex component 5-like isoform X2 n=1 Tax=Homarus americanus TaxID=6706 RepID=UPI001C491A01|nr:gamma-tubulin complex component 5-like isoform X2 [Homarus americanus]
MVRKRQLIIDDYPYILLYSGLLDRGLTPCSRIAPGLRLRSEGEENFVRSEQFVLSNLLYHHCLAVNSHAVRRSIEGIALKFTIHGQHHRAQLLTSLTSEFLASPLFKDHFQTDVEWSLLSVLLHLSNSPTQVPVQEVQNKASSPESTVDSLPEQIDWGTYLRNEEPKYVLGPEEPLSDWSSDGECSDDEDTKAFQQQAHTAKNLHSSNLRTEPSLKQPTTRELLEQVHRAKSWLSAKTHIQYWGSKRPHQLPLSDHPSANVAKLWETERGLRGLCQHLSEWAVMREVLWVFLCPVPAHIFILNSKGSFILKSNVTIASLTPGATSSLLEHLCEPLNQLRILDAFMHKCEFPSVDPPTPATILAYAAGLRLWRHRFQSYLVALEDCIKKQECTCTLLWLEGELRPWLRTLATIFAMHSIAFSTTTKKNPKYTAIRVLGTLCEGVEGTSEAGIRGVLLRLLLHSLRHYLSIIHSWLLHGTLVDHAQEFIIQRDESVKAHNERFWRGAFTISLEEDDQNCDTQDPMKTILKFLSPLVAALTTVGKSRELLAILDVQPLSNSSITCSLSQLKAEIDQEQSLEEVVVKYIKKTVCETRGGSKVEDEKDGDESEEEADSVLEVSNYLTPGWEQEDPLLLAAFTDTFQESLQNTSSVAMDSITSLIEDIGDVPQAVSVVSLLTSALRPLVKSKEDELSARLTCVLIEEYHLDRHCQAVRSVLLMEAGDIMHEFYTHLFSKLESGESVDGISLTLHLQYCIARLYPDLAQFFSVSLAQQAYSVEAAKWEDYTKDSEDDLELDADKNDGMLVIDKITGSGRKALRGDHVKEYSSKKACETPSNMALSRTGLPDISIQYQAPWPANLLLTESIMRQFNMLFHFSLSLKRATNGLERLKFRDLASFQTITSTARTTGETTVPLRSRLHRLQLLRQWLLCFSRELHDHFANTVFLPYHQAVEKLFSSRPSLNTIITEHEKMVNKLITDCLMGNSEEILPLQIVLNKVFWLTQRLGQLWLRDIGQVSSDELTSLETKYAKVHRYLVNVLTTLVTIRFVPHMEGLTRTLVDTVPLLTQQ